MPAVTGRAVVVDGLADLQKAWRVADRETGKQFRAALKSAGEPVRRDAERLAVTSISGIGRPWSRMRTGVTLKSVYVAPRHRGTRNRALRRPNLADLLLRRAMQPALNLNRVQVEERVQDALNTVGRKWENA